MTIARARSGLALFGALALMAILGILIAGAVAAVRTAERSAQFAESDARLESTADYAIGELLTAPARYGLPDLPLGVARTFAVAVEGGGTNRGAVSVSATRLPASVLWVAASAANAPPDSGRRRVGLVARFPIPGAVPPAPIVARGDVTARDGVSFSTDSTSDADCVSPRTADVVTPPAARVTLAAGERATTSALASDTNAYFLMAWQLARLDSSPSVVHVRGDTTVAGGAFEGVFIADGAIIVDGTFQVSGLMIARDSIVSSSETAGGLRVTGALLAFGGSTAVRLSNASIVYAPCTIARMLRRATSPRPVRGRAWAELF